MTRLAWFALALLAGLAMWFAIIALLVNAPWLALAALGVAILAGGRFADGYLESWWLRREARQRNPRR